MPISERSIVRVDYHLYVDGKLSETTDEERSKKEDLHKDGRIYRPFQFTTGVAQIIPGLEKDVMTRDGPSDVQHKVDVEPKDAYGPRRPELLKIVPSARLKGQRAEVGQRVNIDGMDGTVTRIAGGRIVIDTNHPLAGKLLTYEYTIREVLTTSRDKVRAIAERAIPLASVEWTEEDLMVTIDVPQEEIVRQNWQASKMAILRQIRMVLGDHEPVIRFIENYEPPPRPNPAQQEPSVLAA